MTTPAVMMVVDDAPASALVDLEPARTWMLAEALQRQHALMTAWGGPGSFCGLRASEGDTASLRIRVPPGVTDADLTLFVTGTGDVTVTSTTDSTGTRLTWATSQDALSNLGTVSTAGEIDSSAGADSGRAVTVASSYDVSTSWVWNDERLIFTLAAGGSGTIHGVMVRPIHVAR